MRNAMEHYGRKIGLLALMFAVVLAVASLAACEVFGPKIPLDEQQVESLSPEQKVFYYSTKFKYARALAVAYKEQGPCNSTRILACADPEVVKAIQDADLGVESALNAARQSPDQAKLAALATAYRLLARILEREIAEALLI